MKKQLPLILLTIVFVAGLQAATPPGIGWSAYGGDAGGSRYSSLSQITPDNVHSLELAWTFRTGEMGKGVMDWEGTAFEATPILYNGTLYLTTSGTDVIAVDAATGVLRWRHASENNKQLHYSDGVSRGVSLWVDADAFEQQACRTRIFAPTLDGRLLALDAATGDPCLDFGDQGSVDLLVDINLTDQHDSIWRNYLVTSPPAVLDNKVIVGSSIGDGRAVEEELGIVRAFDARTGKLLWQWDPIPRDPSNPGYSDWHADNVAVASAANAWAPLSVDPDRHWVFVPTGSASPDFFGGTRAGNNRWANSLVALDGETGQLVWGQQLVHHDVWDYDLASQPTLVSLKHEGVTLDAVIQATKTGLLFTFNRETGEPVFAIEERLVPQNGVPGEQLSPTQPFPVAPPPLARQTPVTEEDAWGLTWFDRQSCRKQISALRSDGIFTPPTTRGSLMLPGNAGGVNWGGIAFDHERQIAITNVLNVPFVVALIPREELPAARESGRFDDYEFAQQRGTPFAMVRRAFISKLGVPCVKPPWGSLVAVDMARGTVKWSVPLGNTPFLPWNLGVPNLGGPIVTASGLIFIAASFDDRLRAFSVETGEELWEVKLPAGGQATPMTYEIDGRQFLVIAAGGYKDDTTRGDYLVAYALP